MLIPEELDRICIVLVRARNPNNIGAAARAMHDFGLRHLRVVNDFPVPFESARSAVDANDVLASAVACATLAEAVADCTLVVGTTAVGERDLQHPLLPLAEAAPRLRAELRRSRSSSHNESVSEEVSASRGAGILPDSNPGRVALLFGSEKTGLSNEEMSHCNWLLTIPMQPYADVRHASMNLGQAVAVCLYELVRDESEPRKLARDEPQPQSLAGDPANSPAAESPTTAADLERLTTLLAETLEKSGYLRRHPANCEPAQLRRLLRRMAADANDAPIWMGIFRQLLWKIRRACD
jgi:tRNA/rRNA methyltransferase